jgi:predicted  nucleic acid-binding Zn-ribbon protein
MSNIETLQNKRTELEKQVEELQLRNAEHEFEIDLEERRIVKTVMDHLDKGYTWKTQNAAVVVTLYDRLKKQYKELTSEDEGAVVKLRGHELNGLYQALLGVEGTGVESARRFIKMLTMVGEAVTDAMKVLGEMNKEVQDLHGELSELDQDIQALQAAETTESVEPELEVVTDETEK